MRLLRVVATAVTAMATTLAIVWLAGSSYSHPVTVHGLQARYSCSGARLTVSGRISPPNITLRATSLQIVDGVGVVEVLGSWWLPTEIPPRWDFTASRDLPGGDPPSIVTTRPPARHRIAAVERDASCEEGIDAHQP